MLLSMLWCSAFFSVFFVNTYSMQCKSPVVEFSEDCSPDTTCMCGQLINKEIKLEVDSVVDTMEDMIEKISSRKERIVEKVRNMILDREAQTCYNSTLSNLPANCKEVFARGYTTSGIHLIQPSTASKPFHVLCERNFDGHGWTVILNRFCGNQTFELGWDNYKAGFGNLTREFWLGLQHIHELTSDGLNELYIFIKNQKYQIFRYKYKKFEVGSEAEGYKLKEIGNLEVDTVYFNDIDILRTDNLRYNVGSKFSTPDRDHDNSHKHCAKEYSGGWWYNDCILYSNPLGKCVNSDLSDPKKYFYWTGINSKDEGLKSFMPTRMRMMLGPPHSYH